MILSHIKYYVVFGIKYSKREIELLVFGKKSKENKEQTYRLRKCFVSKKNVNFAI